MLRSHPVRSRLSVAALAAAVGIAGLSLLTPADAAGRSKTFSISGSTLKDGNGKPFVMRGVNHTFAAHTDQVMALVDMKKAGANTVQVELSGGRYTTTTVAQVRAVVSQCVKSKLICVFVDVDTSGYGEAGETSAISMTKAVDYWVSLKSALEGNERYVIINIGQDPYGTTAAQDWTMDAKAAVKKLRAAGFKHTLLVSAPDYGQDTSSVMRTKAGDVAAADPLKNTGFAIKMFSAFQSAESVKSYLNAFKQKNLYVTIGGFSWAQLPYGDVDEDSIMAVSQQMGVGWLAYAWSGSSIDKVSMDMVANFSAGTATVWGSRVMTGANGLSATSKPASVY